MGAHICDTSAVTSTIGQRIKIAREERGWSQPELARRAGCGHQMISKIERDKLTGNRTSEVLPNVKKILGLTDEPPGDGGPESWNGDDPVDWLARTFSKKQLVSALTRIIYAEASGGDHDQSNVAPFGFPERTHRGEQRRAPGADEA